MEISIRLEMAGGKAAMAVYVSGKCIRKGLTEAEAGALAARLLNEEFAQPRL